MIVSLYHKNIPYNKSAIVQKVTQSLIMLKDKPVEVLILIKSILRTHEIFTKLLSTNFIELTFMALITIDCVVEPILTR